MPTAPGFADVSVQIVLAGFPRTAFITFGVDPTATDPDAIGASIGGALSATGSLYTQIIPTASFTGVRVSLGTDGGEDLVGFHPMARTGTKAVTTLSANCAALLHKRTARGGRRGRGRMYLPWSRQESIVDEAGVVGSTDVNALNAAATAFLAALTAASCPMVLLHQPSEPWDPIKETGVEHPTTPGPPNLVTSMTCDGVVGTQRRRLGR